MSISVILVDDEPGARELMRSYLENDHEIEIKAECSTGHQAIEAITKHQPDIVFLDIQMPTMTGFEVLNKLSDPYPIIIFATAYDNFAIKAFEVNALDYLLKPFDKKRFLESLDRARKTVLKEGQKIDSEQISMLLSHLDQTKNSYKEKLIARQKNKSVFIKVSDIEYIEGYDNYTRLHVESGAKLSNYKLKDLELLLDPDVFIRVHKSYLVNVNKINALEPFTHGEYILYMENGKEIKLSRTYKDQLQRIIK